MRPAVSATEKESTTARARKGVAPAAEPPSSVTATAVVAAETKHRQPDLHPEWPNRDPKVWADLVDAADEAGFPFLGTSPGASEHGGSVSTDVSCLESYCPEDAGEAAEATSLSLGNNASGTVASPAEPQHHDACLCKACHDHRLATAREAAVRTINLCKNPICAEPGCDRKGDAGFSSDRGGSFCSTHFVNTDWRLLRPSSLEATETSDGCKPYRLRETDKTRAGFLPTCLLCLDAINPTELVRKVSPTSSRRLHESCRQRSMDLQRNRKS